LEAGEHSALFLRVRKLNICRGLGLWAGLCLAGASPGLAVETGMARVNVVQELGPPMAAQTKGNTEVLIYKGGVKITLTNGHVTGMTGLKPAEGAEARPAKPEKEMEEEPKEPVPTKEELAERARQEKKWAEADAKARAEMEKSLTDLENMHGRPPPKVGPPAFNPAQFLLGLAVKWVLTLAALKLTCKYWGCEVFWSGLMTVAAVDVGVRSVIGLAGFLLLKMTSLFYADEAIAAVFMVLVLRKVSINQSLAQAVQITMTTKTFSVVVGSALFVILLHLWH
jgi:hypothetical protein